MSIEPLFRDRHVAGLALARLLEGHAHRSDTVVLGMARGGITVAAPIARALGAPLEAFVARKLGVPGVEEVAFGALAEGGGPPVLEPVQRFIGLPHRVMATVYARELIEIGRRVRSYRDGRALPDLTGKTVIVVDDGLASGATLRAAGIALRRCRPARLIAAVPVASADGVREVSATFEEVVIIATPHPFGMVSDWYHDYPSIDDAEVRATLGLSPNAGPSAAEELPTECERRVIVPIDDGPSGDAMVGDLGGDTDPEGLVIFAHGGGSSRASYRNRYLAGRLRLAGWATLRLDLLSTSEQRVDAQQGACRFDIDLISGRLLTATRWCLDRRVPGSGRIVLFGASTGAAAAVNAAASLGARIAGLVARGGRIDLAGSALGRVRAPSLLIVGGADEETLRLNRESAGVLGGPATLRVIRGAGHTFEELGALGQVGEVVTSWLTRRHRIDRARRWLTGRAETQLTT